jgi:hypothetical protein
VVAAAGAARRETLFYVVTRKEAGGVYVRVSLSIGVGRGSGALYDGAAGDGGRGGGVAIE